MTDEHEELNEIRERDAKGLVSRESRAQLFADRRAVLRFVAHVGRKPLAPYVHLNGTSKEELLVQLRCARAAIETARDVLQLARPHGRDYYVISDTALKQAEGEHLSRMERLTSVLEEITEIYIDIYREPRGMERARPASVGEEVGEERRCTGEYDADEEAVSR